MEIIAKALQHMHIYNYKLVELAGTNLFQH